MNRFTFPLLMLGVSLAPLLCWAAEPKADQAPAAESLPNEKAPAGLLPKASDNDAALLKAAKEERVKVLSNLLESMTLQYKLGTIDFIQLSSAHDELCDAQLEATDELEKRVALLTKQLDRANEVAKIAQARFEAGGAITQVEVLRTKSIYLNVKIKLLRERSGKRPLTPSPTEKRS